jgi:hypothetical protein
MHGQQNMKKSQLPFALPPVKELTVLIEKRLVERQTRSVRLGEEINLVPQPVFEPWFV